MITFKKVLNEISAADYRPKSESKEDSEEKVRAPEEEVPEGDLTEADLIVAESKKTKQSITKKNV